MASINKTAKRLEALQSGEDKERRAAALWLGEKGVTEAFDPLLAALQDSSWKVRQSAAIALGNLGNIEAVEPLIASLKDTTLSVKRAAINALGMLGDVRATESLMPFHSHLQLGPDALEALLQIGAPALLFCCQQLQSESQTVRNIAQGAAREMLRLDSATLFKETLRNEARNDRERWLVLEMMRKVYTSLTFLDTWIWPRFCRITDIPGWCEQTLRDPNLSDLHVGCKQVLDYSMLGRASQRDDTTESDELLRAAGGTPNRDTGETLLRASDQSAETPATPSLPNRLRRWLAACGRKVLP